MGSLEALDLVKTYREIVIRSSTHDANYLARHIELFAERSHEWRYPPKESSLYEESLGRPACCIVTSTDSVPLAAIHFAKKTDHSLYMTNIVPLSVGHLNIGQYNAIAEFFTKSIRKHKKSSGINLKIFLSKSEIKLNDIITGGIPKKLLKRYLSMHPLSHHPSDIGRLDQFICALSRYSRKHIDLDAFQALLMEEYGWSSKDANWCRTRVDIGLEVLAANKKF